MLKIGCAILSIWTVLNLIPSGVILIDTIWGDGHTPGIYLLLTEEEVAGLEPDVVATMDSMAVFANDLNIAFCLVSLVTIWFGLIRRQKWAFWGLLAGFTFAVLAGVGADYEVGLAAPMVNVISAGILAAGLVCAAIGLFGVGVSAHGEA